MTNELRILAASLRMSAEGAREVYGRELFAQLAQWEGEATMYPATLYRCLRALEDRGLFRTKSRPSAAGPERVCYTLTPAGREAARAAVVQLLASDTPPPWVDLHYALPRGNVGRQPRQ